MTLDIAKGAAEARSQGARDTTARPSQRRHAGDWEGTSPARVARRFEVRSTGDGQPLVAGFASVTAAPYEMWDMFGPYTELVAPGAFGVTLGKDPMVEFTANHAAGGGLPMAHTRNDTLNLTEITNAETTGLWYEAQVDSTRTDVGDMLKAMERGDLAEASFKFTITRGQWSPDWMEYHIEEVDLNRGDVSAVNFGANPAATSGVRAVIGKIQQGRALDPADVNMITQAMAWFTALDSIVDEAQEALAGYLGVPSPDPDDATALSVPASGTTRVLIAEAETRHRTLSN